MEKNIIVEKTDKETIDKLKKRWKIVENVADGLIIFNSAGFATSLTPLDDLIDAGTPVVEIITAVLTAGSVVIKEIAKSKQADLEGKEYKTSDIKEEDIKQVNESIRTAIDKAIDNNKAKNKAA